MSIIIPAAGQSSRFGKTRPKWLLTQPNGELMIVDSIMQLDLDIVNTIYISVLQEHINKYCNGRTDFLQTIFENKFKKPTYIFIIQTPTSSQCETVYKTIKHFDIKTSIFIKDVDNTFKHTVSFDNGLCFIDIKDYDNIKRLSGKSYISTNELNEIINIVEKKINGSKICVSGYSFEDPNTFCTYYEHLSSLENLKHKELYISHIVYKMIISKVIFKANHVERYTDWGTYEDWLEYKKEYATLFIDLDGVLMINSSEYFEPNWSNSDPIQENIDCLKKIKKERNVYIVITTSRKKTFKKATKQLLDTYEIPYDKLVFGLFHCKRILINDYSNTNIYPTAISINLKRNDPSLSDMLHF